MLKRLRTGLALGLLVFETIVSPLSHAADGGNEVQVAENVFVVPDKNATAIQGWLIVMAGCADEPKNDCRGIAHYLEHLLFINRDADNKSKVAFFPGGTGNGWTTHKSTFYYQRFPSNPETNAANLDKLAGYFASLLTDVRADSAQAERERNVVLQEYQQNSGRSVFARFANTRTAALMPGDALGQRVGGGPEDIKGYSIDAARAFHAQWYAKSNTVLVLHGPIDPQAIKPLIVKYFDPLPDKKVPGHTWVAARKYEPGSQTLSEKTKDAKQTGVYLDKIVTYDEPGTIAERRTLNAARGIAAAYLGTQLRGSLTDELMERDGLINQGGISIAKLRAGTLRVSFWAVPADGIAPEKIIDAARTYLASLAKRGLTAKDIDRLKMRTKNAAVLLPEEPERYANALVNWFTEHNLYNQWHDRLVAYDNATAADVQTVLGIIARPGREVIGVITPQPAAVAGATPAVAPGQPAQ